MYVCQLLLIVGLVWFRPLEISPFRNTSKTVLGLWFLFLLGRVHLSFVSSTVCEEEYVNEVKYSFSGCLQVSYFYCVEVLVQYACIVLNSHVIAALV